MTFDPVEHAVELPGPLFQNKNRKCYYDVCPLIFITSNLRNSP